MSAPRLAPRLARRLALRLALRLARLYGVLRQPTGRLPTSRQPTSRQPTHPQVGRSRYPGDFTGPVEIGYAPKPDGRPDPGEIVWTWVPYEEDHALGKDRPVLLIGRDGPWLLALQLTSKDHDRDAAHERRGGRGWVDIGSGAWDRRGRPSEVRVDRILRIAPADIRREGAVLAEGQFAAVAAAVRRLA